MREFICPNCAGQDVFDRFSLTPNKMQVTAKNVAITDGKDGEPEIIVRCAKCHTIVYREKGSGREDND